MNEALMNRAGDAVSGYRDAAAESRAAAKQAMLERMQGRGVDSLSPDVASLMSRLQKPAAGKTLSSDDVAMLALLEEGLKRSGGADKKAVYGALDAAEQARAIEYMVNRDMANRLAPGPQEMMNTGMASLSELLADPGMRGKLARLGAFSGGGFGAVAGTTAGAQGLMQLIAYLQGEPGPEQY